MREGKGGDGGEYSTWILFFSEGGSMFSTMIRKRHHGYAEKGKKLTITFSSPFTAPTDAIL